MKTRFWRVYRATFAVAVIRIQQQQQQQQRGTTRTILWEQIRGSRSAPAYYHNISNINSSSSSADGVAVPFTVPPNVKSLIGRDVTIRNSNQHNKQKTHCRSTITHINTIAPRTIDTSFRNIKWKTFRVAGRIYQTTATTIATATLRIMHPVDCAGAIPRTMLLE